MRCRILVLMLVLFALALGATPAFGATYRVDLSQSTYVPANATDVIVEVNPSEGVSLPYSIDILVPAGYDLDTALAPGTVVSEDGRMVIDAVARSSAVTVPVSDLPVAATMVVAAPGSGGTCTGTTSHALVFQLDFDLTQVKLQVPPQFLGQIPDHLPGYAFIDPASGPDLAAGYAYRLHVCLPLVSIPPVTVEGMTFTVSILMTDFEATFTKLFTTPSDLRTSTWSWLFAAWNTANTGPDPQGVVESRAVVGLSDLLTLGVVGKKVVKPRATVRLNGALHGQLAAGGETVTILRGASKGNLPLAATATTRPTGAFAFTTKAPRKGKLFFLATFGPAGLDVTSTACAAPHPAASLGCTSATLGGITSKLVGVTVKKR